MFERYLHDAIRAAQASGSPIEIRGGNRVETVAHASDHTALGVSTPDGRYDVEASWVVACDGARSPLRTMLGLGFEGRVFEDNFLIADVRMSAPFRQSAGSGSSRISSRAIPRSAQAAGRRLASRLPARLGHRPRAGNWSRSAFARGWMRCSAPASTTSSTGAPSTRSSAGAWSASATAGSCLPATAAHQVSPFGARGANSGIQDADNLGWKLAMVVQGAASEVLLDSYGFERVRAADENILHSTRATDFITPKSAPRNCSATRCSRCRPCTLRPHGEFGRLPRRRSTTVRRSMAPTVPRFPRERGRAVLASTCRLRMAGSLARLGTGFITVLTIDCDEAGSVTEKDAAASRARADRRRQSEACGALSRRSGRRGLPHPPDHMSRPAGTIGTGTPSRQPWLAPSEGNRDARDRSEPLAS